MECLFTVEPHGFVKREGVTTSKRADEVERALFLMGSTYRSFKCTRVPFNLHDACSDRCVGFGSTYSFARSKKALIPNLYSLMKLISRAPFPELSVSIPFKKKRSVVMFRGATTGDADPLKNKRIQIVKIGEGKKLFDVGLTSICQTFKSNSGLYSPYQKKPIEPDSWHPFKYILDIDGNASSWERMRTTFLVGSLCVRLEPEFEEHWYCDAPFREISFETSIENLLRDVEMFIKPPNDSFLADIAHRGRLFAEERFRPEMLLFDLRRGIEDWVDLFGS